VQDYLGDVSEFSFEEGVDVLALFGGSFGFDKQGKVLVEIDGSSLAAPV
jgi:hypothetical protein